MLDRDTPMVRTAIVTHTTRERTSQWPCKVIPRFCSLVPSVTTPPLYSPTVSKALRQALRGAVASKLPRTSLPETVWKVAQGPLESGFRYYNGARTGLLCPVSAVRMAIGRVVREFPDSLSKHFGG